MIMLQPVGIITLVCAVWSLCSSEHDKQMVCADICCKYTCYYFGVDHE